MGTYRAAARTARLAAPLALFAIGLAAGCQPAAPPPRSAKPAAEPEAKNQVAVARVRVRELNEGLTLPASIEADAVAPLMPQVQAYVSRVNVDIGDAVTRGQVLVELEAPQLVEQVNRKAKQVEQGLAEVRLAEAEVEAAQAKLAAQRAMVELRASERRRIGQLAGQGVLTEQRRDEADFGEKAARAGLASIESDLAVARAKVDRAKAQVGVAEAHLAEAESMAGYLRVVAPFDGVVTHRGVDPGVLVEPATRMDSTPLVTVSDTSKLRAIVHLTFEDAPRVAIGARVELRINDAPGEAIAGSLARTSGVFDSQTRMMRAEIDAPNPAGVDGRTRLRAGGYGMAKIETERLSLPSAPAGAVLGAGEERFVMKVGPSGSVRKTPVTVAIEVDGVVGFASGVGEGDRVVAADADRVADGDKLAGRILEVDE
ncbi:MAG: efflux RND transporter periplasmic adaptor subunit [Planctomycetota bacterium]